MIYPGLTLLGNVRLGRFEATEKAQRAARKLRKSSLLFCYTMLRDGADEGLYDPALSPTEHVRNRLNP